MKRPILWATLYFISGIYLRLGISEMVCLVFVLFAIFSMVYFFRIYKNWKYMLLYVFTVLGFILANGSIQKEMLDTQFSGIAYGEGVVKENGITSAGNQKLTIVCDIWDDDGNAKENVKIYAVWTGEARFEAGDQVSFSGKLIPFYEASVPGGYGENLYLRTRGFDGKMYPEKITYLGEDVSLLSVLARMRAKVHTVLDEILPVNESGIMKAMMTGEKDDIPDESYELYRKAGVVHILCISGLHMSILAVYVSFFMERILKQSRRVSAVVTMLAAVGFLIFTGFTPSAVRAVTMICVVMLARVIFRVHDRLNEISIAAMLILLTEPLYLFHIGFQLSFITVLGLCLAAERMETKKKDEKMPLDWLKESFRFSLYASLFSFPLVAYHFYSVSLVGILANLFVIPLSGMLLGFGIFSAALGLICLPLGVFAAGSVYGILQFFEVTCTILLRFPYSCVLTGRPSEIVILLCYALLFFWMKFSERKGSWKGAAILCILLWCAVFENQLFRKETMVTFLDVGQGDAAVISTYDRKIYLIDGGGIHGREFGENVGKTILLPYLEYLGAEQVDAVFLSHPDSDHMIGLLELLGEISVKELYLADYPYAVTESLSFLKENVEKYPLALYTVDNMSALSDEIWEFLYPIHGISFQTKDDNHGSMVLKYCCNDTEVLFTGDIGLEDEAFLLQNEADLSADILKVSHHGSQYGSGTEFLEKTGAKVAIISCGENNIYGHPHKDTLERLKDAGMETYRTDENGTILLKLKRDGTFITETMTERKPLYERVKETMEKW